MLSGRAWWVANQNRYPNSRDINDLHADFRANVADFIGILRNAGAQVNIRSTRRNANRAYLMHYCWRIANGDIAPADVPAKTGVDIQWDHADDKVSRQAASEMVSLFGLVVRPSVTSNHISGLAIDMKITWKGDLHLGPLRNRSCIIGGPRDGARNRELHEVGESFGVRKLLKDPPHWSHNGR